MGHIHNVHDTDARFIIDPITRTIKNESKKKIVLVQGDHNSEIFSFQCPRYVESHDMSQCNKIEVHFFNYDSQSKHINSGKYEVKDLHVGEDEKTVEFSWRISGNGTQLQGNLEFLIRFKCVGEDNVVTYAWNTLFFTETSIGRGSNVDELFETEYVDIIEQWKSSVLQIFEDEFTEWKEKIETQVSTDINRWKQEASDEVDDHFNEHKAQWNQALAVERARIDQFTSLEEGSTTGDAELMDIRIGADGIPYGNAGDAVRKQIKSMQNDMKGLITCGHPSLNTFAKWVNGGVTSGEVVPTMINRIATDNVLMFNRDVILFIGGGYRMGIHLLDEAGTFLKDSGWKTSEYYIPKNSPFRIVIAQVDETMDRADIHEFSSALSIQDYSSTQTRDLHDIVNSIDKTFALDQFPGENPYNQVVYVDIRKGEFEFTPSFYCTVNLGYMDGTEEHISDGVLANETFTFSVDRPIKYIRCYAQLVPLNIHLRAKNRITKIEDDIAALKKPPRKKCWLTSAHRGFVDSVLKENSLGAYYNAYLNGADMIETDAWLASDGVLVVNHDPTVTGINPSGETVTYTISETPSNDICSLILSSDDKWGVQKVPTLEQVLNLAYHTGLIVNIDMKNGYTATEAIVDLVLKCGMRGKVIYALNGSGMNGINKILAKDTDARFIDSASHFMNAVAGFAERGKRCFAYTSNLNEETVNAIREGGCMVALTSLNASNFEAAMTHHPDMCEYLHTSDFKAIEDAYFDSIKLY